MSARKGGTVLVVEDHEDTREIFATALTGAGFRVYPVATYEEGRDALDTVQLDIVILDIGRHGAGLAHAAVRRRRHPPRLIAVMGRAPERDRRELLFDAYLLKPCLPENVVLAVEAILTRGLA